MPNNAIDPDTAETLGALAAAHRILEMEGHGDLTLGHMSLRDPAGRGLWLKRHGIGMEEVQNADDFILIDFDGNRLTGDGDMHSEWPIHTEVMRRRDDVNIVAHTHPFHACLISATRTPMAFLIQDSAYFAHGLPYYEGTSGLVNTPEKGAALAEALGDATVVFMTNHGVTFCGASVDATTLTGVFLEKACKAQILLQGSGLDWSEPHDKERLGEGVAGCLPQSTIEHHWVYLNRKLARREKGAGF